MSRSDMEKVLARVAATEVEEDDSEVEVDEMGLPMPDESSWNVDERKAYLDSVEMPLLFMDEEDIEEAREKGHGGLGVIEAVREQSTPWGLAKEMKQKGNSLFVLAVKSKKTKERRRLYKQTLGSYSDGIEQHAAAMAAADPPPAEEAAPMLSQLYSNRAAVHLRLRNHRAVLNDCANAVRVWPENVKAHHRAGTAALALHKLDEATAHCNAGLAVDAENKALAKLHAQIEAKLEAAREKARKIAAAIAAKEAKKAALASAIEARGLVIGLEDVVAGMGGYTDKPYLDPEDGAALHWPIVFLYEEHSQMDYLRDVDERDALSAHLENVFAERPGWDQEGTYRPDQLEVFFLAHCVTKAEAATRLRVWVRVPLFDDAGAPISLRAVLDHPLYEIPRIPMLWIIASKSAYRRQFLKSRRVIEFDDL